MAEKEKEQKPEPGKKVKKTGGGQDIISKINDYVAYIQIIYAERGFEPFKIPVLVVLGIFFCIYFFVYTKLDPKIMEFSEQLENQKTIAASLGEYNAAKARITEYKKKLPMYKDREEWLNYIIISTAKELEIELESLSPQRMTEQGAFAIASRDVETTLEFDTVGRWVEKLENAPVFIRITDFSIDRIPDAPMYVKLKMSISTLFIKD